MSVADFDEAEWERRFRTPLSGLEWASVVVLAVVIGASLALFGYFVFLWCSHIGPVAS